MTSEDLKHEASVDEGRNEDVQPVQARSSKANGLKRHCQRFWWVHLIIFLAGVLIVTLILIFVGIPKIAQSKINSAKLEIQGVSVLQATPDSYQLGINSTITTGGGTKATVYPFTGELYLEDLADHTPFLTVNFPQTNGNKHQKVNITQSVTITNQTAFDQFNVWFYKNETIRVTIDGHTQVKVSGIDRKYGVHFKKTVTLNGLNRFQGTEVTDGHIVTTPNSPYNFVGHSKIPNASVYTLDIGNATFTTFLGDQAVGNLTITDLTLIPGDNIVPMQSNLNQFAVIEAATSKPYCTQGGILPLKLLGTDVVNNGKSLTYYVDALSSANQTVDINIGTVLGTKISCTS